MKPLLFIYFLIILVLPVTFTGAAELYVSPSGTNDTANKYPDWIGAATNIQTAVDAAVAGDTVFVTNETYALITNIVVTSGITLRSWNNGALDPTNTVLDGQDSVRCLYINHTNALVAGFTITNGNGVGDMDSQGGGVRMGGIWSAWTSGGTLSNCIVTGNAAAGSGSGGGVLSYGRASLITDCRIAGNTAGTSGGGAFVYTGTIRNSTLEGNTSFSAITYGGGGLYLAADDRVAEPYKYYNGIADNCRIVGNEATISGGGVLMAGDGHVRLLNSTVSNNVASGTTASTWGGGIYLHYTVDALITNCVIESNSGYYGGGLVFNHNDSGHGVTISNCVIRNNEGRSRCGGVLEAQATGSIVPAIRLYNTTIEGNTSVGWQGGAFLGNGVIIENCVIRNNQGSQYGGLLIKSTGTGTSIVRNCLIVRNTNTASWGAAGLTIPSNTFVQSCTIVSNVATHADDGKGGLHFSVDGGTVSNTIIMFNTGSGGSNWTVEASVTGMFSYGCTMPTNGLVGTGNIEADSQFINRNAGNYRLNRGSPCINAGINQDWMTDNKDMDGEPRIDPWTKKVDMGVYERMPSGILIRTR